MNARVCVGRVVHWDPRRDEGHISTGGGPDLHFAVRNLTGQWAGPPRVGQRVVFTRPNNPDMQIAFDVRPLGS